MESKRGILISGLHSSSGKTAVTCMVLAALSQRGFSVQPFKTGPDFIDPGYHNQFANGAVSRNLDMWLMGAKSIANEVAVHTTHSVGVIEGVMGLFDGSDPLSDEGSTVELARLLDWPVILVLPSSKVGRSISAVLRGFLAEAGANRIAGVILNQVSGDSHAHYLKEAISPLGIPVLGAIPACDNLRWPERHLGLRASQEGGIPSPQDLAKLAEQYLDMEGIRGLFEAPDKTVAISTFPTPSRRIGIARDEAFHFYYQANLDYLNANGCELIEFSPVHDSQLPENLDGLYLSGGFPELFAQKLTENKAMLEGVRDKIQSGLPCYAECGGLMYLAAHLVTLDSKRFPMCGVLSGYVEMKRGLQNFGYCVATAQDGNEYHGHEFHHSIWNGESEHANLWNVRRRRVGSKRTEGFGLPNLHASYVHLHFASSGSIADKLFNLKTVREGARK